MDLLTREYGGESRRGVDPQHMPQVANFPSQHNDFRLSSSRVLTKRAKRVDNVVAACCNLLFGGYRPRTTSILARICSSRFGDNRPIRLLRNARSTATSWEALATEFFGRPVTLAVRSVFPGAPSHFRLLVGGTHSAVPSRLRLRGLPYTMTTGRRNPGAKPDGAGSSAHQISPWRSLPFHSTQRSLGGRLGERILLPIQCVDHTIHGLGDLVRGVPAEILRECLAPDASLRASSGSSWALLGAPTRPAHGITLI